MTNLIPVVAGRRTNIMMSQQTSQATQEIIDELIKRTHEKGEERKKKKMELQVGEATMNGSSQEHQQESTEGQMTTVASTKAGHTVLVKCMSTGDKSGKARKTDDESRQEEVDVEEQEEATSDDGDESTEGDDDFDDKPPVVEFEDLACELSQSYELEPEYEDLTLEQEAAEVQALTPREQAEYRELTKLYKWQAELGEKMMVCPK